MNNYKISKFTKGTFDITCMKAQLKNGRLKSEKYTETKEGYIFSISDNECIIYFTLYKIGKFWHLSEKQTGLAIQVSDFTNRQYAVDFLTAYDYDYFKKIKRLLDKNKMLEKIA